MGVNLSRFFLDFQSVQLYQLQIMTALFFKFLITVITSFSHVTELARIASASMNSVSESRDPLPNLKQTRSNMLSLRITFAVGSLEIPL